MQLPHGFEFMDMERLPKGLRGALRDILECGNSPPFRSYYLWAAKTVAQIAHQRGCTKIVELGAGTAPITRELAAGIESQAINLGCTLSPCDLNPDTDTYRQLEARHPGLVVPEYEPFDFSRAHRRWPQGTLVFLSATLHHVPAKDRAAVVHRLAQSADVVLIFEPLRQTFLSGLFCLLSMFPALLCPVVYFNRPQKWRRFLWCWLVPVAPLMFVWDGLISCVRQWTRADWRTSLGAEDVSAIEETIFCQSISLGTARQNSSPTLLREASSLAG